MKAEGPGGRSAVIAGGGIGGLAAGLALVCRGWTVTVLEQAPELAEVGAGIQVAPNGMRILERLGVLDRLGPALFEPEAIEMRLGQSGRPVFRMPMGAVARRRWGAAYAQVHRADLAGALLAELEAAAPGAVRTAARVEGYDPAGALVLSGGERLSGALVVAADGVHSVLRSQMLGPDPARFTGNLAWRAVVPAAGLDVPPTGCIWAGPGKHAVTTRVRGGEMVNFVGVVERNDVTEEGWRIQGTTADALADFGGWSPVLEEVLSRAPTLWRWALFDRAPLPRWSDGAVTLLGDAAHPMVPSLAQGAVQALEDAWVLAEMVTGAEDIPAALRAFAARRLPRVTRVQRQSMANLRMFHRRGLLQPAIYGPLWAMGQIAPGLLYRRLDWLYGQEP